MSTQVKHRRGTAAENASFTGALGEFTYMTDTKRIAAHDAATAGGATFLNVADIQNKAGVYTTAGGTGNAITLAHTFPRTAHTAGAEIQFKASADNSGAVTVAIDSIAGTKALEKMVNGTSTALATGDIKNGVIYVARYDGTRYQLQTGGATAVVSVKKQVFTASGTYTPSAGMVYCIVEAVGGGGAGGSSGLNASGGGGGGGGGAGGYSRSVITAATIGASQTVTIGAAGGDTSLGTLVIGKGGTGGGNGVAGTRGGQGGAGGVAGTGDIALVGNAGHSGGTVGDNSHNPPGGNGGGTIFGGSGTSTMASTGTNGGTNTGGGGGGGSSGAGGSGGTGVIFITEYCSQ